MWGVEWRKGVDVDDIKEGTEGGTGIISHQFDRVLVQCKEIVVVGIGGVINVEIEAAEVGDGVIGPGDWCCGGDSHNEA